LVNTLHSRIVSASVSALSPMFPLARAISPNDKSSLAATDLAAIDRFSERSAMRDTIALRSRLLTAAARKSPTSRRGISWLTTEFHAESPPTVFPRPDLIYIALNNANRADSSGRATEGAFRAKLSFAASSSRLPAVDCG